MNAEEWLKQIDELHISHIQSCVYINKHVWEVWLVCCNHSNFRPMPQDRNQSQIYLWLPRVSSYYNNIQRINKSHCLFSQHFFSIGTCFFRICFICVLKSTHRLTCKWNAPTNSTNYVNKLQQSYECLPTAFDIFLIRYSSVFME